MFFSCTYDRCKFTYDRFVPNNMHCEHEDSPKTVISAVLLCMSFHTVYITLDTLGFIWRPCEKVSDVLRLS